ncbi:MAG: hypothetical protein ACOC7T_00620 [Planctomycetota bacterium]
MALSEYLQAIDGVIKRDDIRGVYGQNIDENFAYNLGRVLAEEFSRCTEVPPVNIAVGHDMRLSGPVLAEALGRGIREGGARPIMMGHAGTELVGFLPAKYSEVIDGGVMITASHNPKDNNGFKFFGRGGLPFPLAVERPGPAPEEELQRVAAGIKKRSLPTVLNWDDFAPDYVQTVLEKGACDFEAAARGQDEPLRIAVEAGNGMGARIIKEFAALTPQFHWSFAHDTPDGNFPVIVPNPLQAEYQAMLRELMQGTDSHVGVCFDGDADRVALMDENGTMVDPPKLTTLVGQRLRQKLGPDQKVAFNLACSWVIADTLGERENVIDGPAVITPVGYGKIKLIMHENPQIAFGAEHSGHYMFRDFWGADSGMMAGLLTLELVAELHSEGKTLSSVLQQWRSRYYPSGEINFEMPARRPARQAIVEAVREFADDVRHIYVVADDRVREVDQYPPEGLELSVPDVRCESEDWWFCMRPSGTEGTGGGILRLYLEAVGDEALMERKRDEFVDFIGPELRT